LTHDEINLTPTRQAGSRPKDPKVEENKIGTEGVDAAINLKSGVKN
jgi:hypothetical protein